jgi:hypothetical protein
MLSCLFVADMKPLQHVLCNTAVLLLLLLLCATEGATATLCDSSVHKRTAALTLQLATPTLCSVWAKAMQQQQQG